jgi:hypothetical protein
VAISHVVVLTGALLTLLTLPCVLVLVVSANEVAVRRRGALRRLGTERRTLRRLDRKIRQPPCLQSIAESQQRMPPIEQIAAELRRLDRQRRGGPTRESEVWSTAVALAYDSWLVAACQRLEVPEQLGALDGDDRDIERVRVEGALQASGLVLRSKATRPPR